jgi:hypothetical protein
MFLYIYLQADNNLDITELFIVKENNKFGIIDIKNEYVLSPEFDFIDKLSNGYARVLKEDKWGFFNQNLNLAIKTEYDYANSFQEDVAAVKAGNKWGFIDTKGAYVIEPKYDWVSNFNNGIAIVKIDEEFYYIDKNENNIFNKTFIYAGTFSSDIAMVQSGQDSMEAIDTEGNVQFSIKTKEFTMVDKFHEQRLVYNYKTKDNAIKCGFMDSNGKSISQNYDKLTYFKNGIAFYGNTIDKKILWGIVDINGKAITDPIFSNVIINSEPLYGASIIDSESKEKWGFINKSGEFIFKPEYDLAGGFHGAYGVIGMKKDGAIKWGIVNIQNINLVECKYQIIYPFSK